MNLRTGTDEEIPQEDQGWVLVPPHDGVSDRRALALRHRMEIHESITKGPLLAEGAYFALWVTS